MLLTPLACSQILSKDEKRGLKGFKRVWDECTRTPFLFNARTRTLISYEDSMSIKLKAVSVRILGLHMDKLAI